MRRNGGIGANFVNGPQSIIAYDFIQLEHFHAAGVTLPWTQWDWVESHGSEF